MTTTTATSAATTAATTTSTTKTGLDHEAFLKLLTAQLQNQDPLAPMDATQFMTQLAQLSSVEQAVETNQTLKEVLEAVRSSGLRGDIAFIGRTVEVDSDQLTLSGGQGQIAYAIDGAPASVKIEVLDSTGAVVKTAAGTPQAGRQVFAWDGKKADGSTAADGVYTVRVTAKAADGTALTTATVATGTVTQVRTVDGESQLVLEGGATVPSADVLATL